MTFNEGMKSSATDEWYTPQTFFQKYDDIYHFDLDVCSTHDNAKCDHHFTKEDDGLEQSWGGHVCWMNPPYGREIGKWVKKAATSGTTVVCLLPARTDTAWWHEWVIPHGKVEFIRGRLKFGGCKNSAPFPSAVVTFGQTQNSSSMS